MIGSPNKIGRATRFAVAHQGTITLEPGSMITFAAPWDGEYYT